MRYLRDTCDQDTSDGGESPATQQWHILTLNFDCISASACAVGHGVKLRQRRCSGLEVTATARLDGFCEAARESIANEKARKRAFCLFLTLQSKKQILVHIQNSLRGSVHRLKSKTQFTCDRNMLPVMFVVLGQLYLYEYVCPLFKNPLHPKKAFVLTKGESLLFQDWCTSACCFV